MYVNRIKKGENFDRKEKKEKEKREKKERKKREKKEREKRERKKKKGGISMCMREYTHVSVIHAHKPS